MGQWEAMVSKTPLDRSSLLFGSGWVVEPSRSSQTVLDSQGRNGWLPIDNSSVRRIEVRLKRNVSSRPTSADNSSGRTNSENNTSKTLLMNWISHAINSMRLALRDFNKTGQCPPYDAAEAMS